MRHVAALALVCLLSCAHSRAAEEHATTTGTTYRETDASEVERERVEEGPTDVVRMDGEWFVRYLNSGPPVEDVGDLEAAREVEPAGAVSVCHGCATPIAPAPAPAVKPRRGLIFVGTVEARHTGPRLEERDRSATSTTREGGIVEVERATKAATETQIGPPPWVWALAWVVGGLVVAGLGALALRRFLP